MDKYRAISKLFTSTFIKELANKNQSRTLKELPTGCKFVANAIKTGDFKKLFNRSYTLLMNNYRCEYIYKSEVYSKIRRENKNLDNWGVLSEVKAEKSIADLVWLNGDSIAYEIKTEIDTNKRLSKQLNSYYKLFNKTCVVTFEENVNKVFDDVPKSTGILILTKDRKLVEYRAPQSFIDSYDHVAMFNTLRKPEYKEVIKEIYGYIPDVPNTMTYKVCLDLFLKTDIIEAQHYMKEQLKKRARKVNSSSKPFPKSIKLLIESGNYKKNELKNITELIT
ncbi:hypothetical protein SAMN05421743_105183 [Thalassobacillus cyri]|uniref:Sce7726 family protein n=1 Tax=Thalassobacillus cyri TaxID=571932 RepID=A0A1H4BX45_9BACI|nr:sce7726 family protein [Thalassobacillus cyri]SEA52696.1 hypothetical protein SAMN05421743_105183 [Thalassobacillus cyri]